MYNRMDKVEDDFSKFEAKPDDFDTIRTALLVHGVVLRKMIEEESEGQITWE